MSTNGSTRTDYDLVAARDRWTGADWENHFNRLNIRTADGARYNPIGDNDVLKTVLLSVQGRSCWVQGGANCKSRALLAREAQIDHVIPRTAHPKELRRAIESSVFQREVFDVHDPGNLAIICGPCNQEKASLSPLEPAYLVRRTRLEKQREKVISGYRRWHRHAAVDDATLKALMGVNLSDEITRSMYADIAIRMVERLATELNVVEDLAHLQTVVVEAQGFLISVEPTTELVEEYVEMIEEIRADDARHGID